MRLQIYILILGFSFLIISCNYRTPSNLRFERITKINLTDSITVIQDKFEESGSDFGLIYVFKVKQKDCLKILKKLEKSNDWKKLDNRLEFQKTNDDINYNIQVLNEENKIIYQEELR